MTSLRQEAQLRERPRAQRQQLAAMKIVALIFLDAATRPSGSGSPSINLGTAAALHVCGN
jgi:hypothetical protein